MRIVKIKTLAAILIFTVLLMDFSAIGIMATSGGKVLDELAKIKQPKIYINSLNPSFQEFKNGMPARIWEEEIIGRVVVSPLGNTPDTGRGMTLSSNIENNWTTGINATGCLSSDVEEIYGKSMENVNRTGTLVLAFLATDLEVLNETLFSDERTRIVVDEILRFAEEVGDAAIVLTGNYCSAMNLIYLLRLAEEDRRVSEIYLIILTHGILNETLQTHGMLMHGESGVAVVNGETLSYVARILNLKGLSKLRFVYLPFCNMGRERKIYGDSSVVAFFEKYCEAKILAYDGETYLNGEYIASVQSVLSSGIYELVEEHVYLPVQIVDNFTGEVVDGYVEFMVIDEIEEVNSTINPYEIYDDSENVTLGHRFGQRINSRARSNYKVTVYGKRVKAVIHRGEPPRNYVRRRVRHVSYGVVPKCRTFGARGPKISFEHRCEARSIPVVAGRFWSPPKTARKSFGNNLAGKLRASISEVRNAILLVDEIFNAIYKYYYGIKSAVYRWIDTTFNAPWNRWMRGLIKTTLDNTVFRGANFIINFAKKYLKTIVSIAYSLKQAGKSLGEIVAALVIAAIAKFAREVLKYFSWGMDKLLGALSNVLSADLKWVKKILDGWVDSKIKFLDSAVAYSEKILRTAIKNFVKVLAEIFKPLIDPILAFVDILKGTVSKFMELLLMKPFYELYAKAIVLAAAKRGDRGGKFVWRDMDLEDFNIIRDLSIVYYEGRKCGYCDVRHYLAEGTKLIPDVAELWLRAKKFLGYGDPMVHVLLSTRMLCEVTIDGEKKLMWIEVGKMSFDKDGNQLIYEYEKGKTRSVDKPLGVVRRIILTYRLEGDRIVVTPVVQVIVGDWVEADESVLRDIRGELEGCGEVKEIVLGSEKMFLAIPTESEHIKRLLGDLKDMKYENLRVLAELCSGDIAKQLEDIKRGEKSKWVRRKIFDFIKPCDADMLSRIFNLYSEVTKGIGEKGGKLLNGVGLYSVVGEWEVAGKVNLVFVDPFWHSYAGLYMISPEVLKDLGELREVLDVKEDLRHRLRDCTYGYRDGNIRYGALCFFHVRVLQLEYLARICGVGFEDFKFRFNVGELSIEDLVKLRENLIGKGGHCWEYLENNGKAKEIFLEICGLKDLSEVSGKRICIGKTEPKPLMEDFLAKMAKDSEAVMLIRTLGMQFQNNLGVLLHLIGEGKAVGDLIKEVEMELSGKKSRKPVVQTICRLVSNYDPARTILSEKWKEIEGKIKDLDEDDPVRMRLEKLRKRIDEHTASLREIGKQIEGVVKSLKNPKTYLAATLQFCLATLLYLIGVAGGLTLIEEKFSFVAQIVKNKYARLGLGVALTAIFIVGINVEGDWIATIVNPGKQFVKALKEEIVDRATTMGKIKDAIMPDKSFTIGMVVGGFATVLKGLGIPFYTTDELCEKLCEWIKSVNHVAGETLQKILSFKIPLIDQTIFDLLISLALGGPAELIADTVIGTVLQRAVMPMINNVAMDVIIKVLLSTT